MRVHDRIYGIETEFAAMIRKANGKFESGDTITKAEYFAYLKRCRSVLFTDQHEGRSWHINGSLVYVDFNEHPEHATAECRSVRDAVAGFKAGELIASEIFGGLLARNDSRLVLFKNNLARDHKGTVTTFGCHDNYSRSQSLTAVGFQESLIPFLVTRQILDGAGTWDDDGNFILSQRAGMIEHIMGGIATSERPIIQGKATPDTGSRIHLVLGDSNILEAACYLKVGTTALVLALMDGGHAPTISYEEPVQSLHDIATSADPHARVFRLRNRDVMSALEVQYMYFQQARRYLPDADYDSEDTREEFMDIIALWGAALEAIANHDREWMLGRLDYATKKYLFDRQIERAAPSYEQGCEMRKNIDILYHNVSDRSLQERMNKHWASRRILSDEEIMRAKHAPPAGTRAQLRGQFVARALAAGKGRAKCAIAWNYVLYVDDKLSERFWLNDPFDIGYDASAFDAYLKKIGI